MRLRTFFVENDDLAGLDIAHVLGADNVERAGFRGEDRTAIQRTEHQWTNAEAIAGADQLLVGHADERISAFELAQPLDEPIDETIAMRPRHQMQNDFGV